MANNKEMHSVKRVMSSMLAAVIAVTSVTTMPVMAADASGSGESTLNYVERDGLIMRSDLAENSDISVRIEDDAATLFSVPDYGVDSDIIDSTDGVFTQAEDSGTSSAEWTGKVATGYAGGEGTEASPYLIATGEQLAYLAQQVNAGNNYSNTYFKLTTDILLNDVVDSNATEWTPIDGEYTFSGVFDGNGHKVIGLYIYDGNTDYMGLFSGNAGTIKNLGVTDGYMMCGGSYIGSICGYNYGTILNCYNTVTIESKTDDTYNYGGVCGYNTGTIEACRNEASITITGGTSSVAKSGIGGVCGFNNGGDIIDSYNTGNINCTSYALYVGGVCGASQDSGNSIKGCYNTGTVKAFATTGGVCGEATLSSITDCYNKGAVTGTQSVGGVCGWLVDGTMENCYNTAAVTGKEDVNDAYYCLHIGGVCGQCTNDHTSTVSYGRITGCYNTGTITGGPEGCTAGICATVENGPVVIEKSYNKGKVINNNAYVDGAEYQPYYTAGICSYMVDTDISECYNEGVISSKFNVVAGIAGYLASNVTINNCYNFGAITANAWAGGIWSNSVANTNTMNDSYNAASVKLTGSYDSLYPVGRLTGSVSGVYYDSDVCKDTKSTNTAHAMTTSALTSKLAIDDMGYDSSVWTKQTNTDYRWYYPDLVAFDNDCPVVISGVPAPENVKATAGSGKIVITWNKVSDASKYRIRRNDGTGWTNYMDVTATSFTDTAVTNGTAYQYAVYAYGYGKWSAVSTIVSVTLSTPAPANVKAVAGDKKVTLTWNAVSGATMYRIRRNGGTGWTNLKDLKTTSYVDTAVTNGTKYSYGVYAYANGAWSAASALVAATPYACVAPATVKATAADKAVTVAWSKVAGATAYRVRRHDGKAWATLANVTANTYKDTAVKNGTKYTYGILAQVNGTWSAASTLVAATPYACVAPATVKATAGDKAVTVTWSKVAGATAYRVRRHDGKAWATLANVTATSYKDTAVTNGTKYTYGILAQVNGTWSAASTLVAATPEAIECIPPASVTIKSESGKVSLSWSAVNGATKYRIRRSDGNGWTNLANVSATSYVDSSVTNGTNYVYGIFAYVNGTWSASSALVQAKPAAVVSGVANGLTITTKANSITLSWNTVSGAEKYRVRRSDGVAWETKQTSAKTTFVDTDVVAGTTYKYSIYCYSNGAFGNPSSTVAAIL